MKPTVEKEVKKGGAKKLPKVETLLGALRFAKEATPFHHEAVANHLGRCAGAMEKAFIPAFA